MAGVRYLTLSLIVLVGVLQFFVANDDASASHTNIKFPFAAGTSWTVLQGYNTNPAQGGSHYNCDPATLKDTVTQTVSCTAPWQYRYSLDVYESGGRTAGMQVLAPVSGTVRWTQASTGGITINMGDGYALALFHVIVNPGIAAGTVLQQGQVIGTVAPANVANAGNTPHIHITLWETTDGGNWSRIARPFTGTSLIDGLSFPDLGATSYNQHRGRAIFSTNQPLSSGTAPNPPTLTSPTSGAALTTANNRIAFTWNSVPDATAYQVIINNSIQSPWVGVPSWTSDAIPNGAYTWKVRAARNQTIGVWSNSSAFTVSADGTPGAAAGITTSLARGKAGEVVTVSGTGFTVGESVDIRWDSATATPISTITADSAGSFTTQITIPDAPRGAHTIFATGRVSLSSPTRPYEVIASLGRTPVEGAPGTNVLVTVKGFAANEQVRLNWVSASGTVIGTATTNAFGTGTVTIQIPNGRPGWTDYVGTGLSSNAVAYGAINVLSTIYVYPGTSAPGGIVHADAGAYPPNVAYTVKFGPSSTTVCSGTVAADGVIRCQFTVPQIDAGGYAVTIAAGSVSRTSTLAITGPPAVSLSPANSAVGTNITIGAGGFSPGETIAFSWDAGAAWQSIVANASGAATLKATVPFVTVGGHTFKATGTTSGTVATVSYSVGATPAPGSTGKIGTGVYSVFATREGLVGGRTSSGHIILPNDYFVSLPGCTPTNCSGGFIPGNMTQCGTKCYVKVINPVTNVCRVEPIYDIGPWFTVDDWWNPTSSRYLNNLSTNPNVLTQGYTAASAARYGLNVGYGVGANGYGQDNTGTTAGRPWREAGSQSAIDLADGTWYALNPTGSAAGATITVEMLWQTGDNPATEAQACGHPLNQTPTNPAVNPPGTENPSFVGVKLPILGSSDAQNTGRSVWTYDNNTGTKWYTNPTTPATARFTLDLGSDKVITGIKWKFDYIGYADEFTVRIVHSSGVSRTYGPFGNATQANLFFGQIESNYTAIRYVEFNFVNARGLPSIGSISEVEIWGAEVKTYPPGTQNPSFSNARLPVVSSTDTPNSGRAPNAYDLHSGTKWYTNPTTPATAQLRFDLGSDKQITGVKWKFDYTGFADQFTIRIVNSQGGSRTYGPFGNATQANVFFGQIESNFTVIRYVEFNFQNPRGLASLGSITEVEIWGTNSNFAAAETAEPDPTGAPISANCIANPESSTEEFNGSRACDLDGGTNWHTDTTTPTSATVTLRLDEPAQLTGIKWSFERQGNADSFTVQAGVDGSMQDLGEFSGGPAQVYEGLAFDEPIIGDTVTLTFTNLDGDAELGFLSEAEVWGIELPDGTPVASPESDSITPEASPEAVETIPSEGTPQSEASPETEPAESTATSEAGVEPPVGLSFGTISNTDGDSVNCRANPINGDVIASLNEGDQVEITGDVEDDWYPVVCDGLGGWVSAEFLTLDDGSSVEATSTAESTEIAVPSEVVVEEPYPIFDTGDTENSGAAWLTSDNNASTFWSVYPGLSPEQTRIYFDLGAVLPIDRLTLNLATWDMLPVFEIWLSENGETWYNATPGGVNGWNLERDTDVTIQLGYDARYVRIVIPDVDESGLSEVGGIRQIDIWPGDINQTSYLSSLGRPTTPTPAAKSTSEPTSDPLIEPTLEPTEEATEEPTVEDVPTEEPPVPTEQPTATEIVEPTTEGTEAAG